MKVLLCSALVLLLILTTSGITTSIINEDQNLPLATPNNEQLIAVLELAC